MKGNLIVILPIILLGFFLIQPEHIGSGQPRTDSIPQDLKVLIEQGKKLDQKQDKQNDSLVEMAMSIQPEKKVIVKKVPIKTAPKVAIRFNGDVYELSPELYKGYVLIDIDSFLRAMYHSRTVVQQPDTSTQIIHINVQTDEQNNWWRKFKNIFNKREK